MIRHIFVVVGLVVLGLSAQILAADPADEWRGVKVLPKENAVVKVGNEIIDDSKFTLPYTVQNVNGDWLWVGDSRKGWVQKSQVVTLDEAPAYYTQLINSNRQNAWAYLLRAAAWDQKGELDQAIADYGEILRIEPTAAIYNNRGNAWDKKQEYDKAIADFDQAIRLDPNDVAAYSNRGWTLQKKKEYDKAIADYNQAIRLAPKDAAAYKNRGWTLQKKKEYDKAIADFNQAIQLDPNLADARNASAWILATCPEASYRNGKKAVEMATKACELSGWRESNNVDTLAAAYAEAGDFDSAIKYQNKAVDLNPKDAEFVKAATQRLALYKDQKPYRE